MAWSFPTASAKKKSLVIAVDLGARGTKAVCVQRRDGGHELLDFKVMDAPVFEKGISPEVLGEHLKAVVEALGAKTKFISLALGVNDSLLRPAEMPLLPVGDLRQMLKFNSKAYFQQDFPDHYFDCHILPPLAAKNPAEAAKTDKKNRVLVGGARKQHIETLQAAAKNGGLVADFITPGIVAAVNAFELAQPEAFAKDVVALVDIGYRTSVITLLLNGDLAMTRVVNIGGDKLTNGIAESMGISYAEAEGIKIGMPQEVQAVMLPQITPLGRELRASIDFFEHQNDRAVSRVFVSGASARSGFIVESLQSEMMVPCEKWNPLTALQTSLPVGEGSDAEAVAPQLTLAIGAALATLS